MINMKPFNLDEYLKNPSKKVVTRGGRNVKIHCTNCAGTLPVIAEIEGEKYSYFYDKNGEFFCRSSISDLFFAPEKKEGWVNLFKDSHCNFVNSCIFKSKEDAEKEGKNWSSYIATVKVDWEE